MTRRDLLLGSSALLAGQQSTSPQFRLVDATQSAGIDFHLRSGSPAIDVGSSLPEVTVDFDGCPRPAGAGYDIGAFER